MGSPRRSAAFTKIGIGALVIALGVGAVAAVTATVNSQASAATQTYPIPASGTFAVSGHGNAPGHGMSQWGAEGAAIAGLSAAQIVAFYYPHTTLTTLAPSTVRVQISDDGGATRVAAKAGLSVTGYGALPTAGVAEWKLVPYQSGLALLRESTTGAWSNAKLGLPAQADFSSTDGFVRLYHADGSYTDYRGTIGAVRSGGSELTINRVALDDYVMGVAPRESPSSWRPAAEQAQAIAARSYARYAVEHNASGPYDICDTDQCQVYGGMAAYSASGALLYTDYPAAITGNQNEVLTYNGATIFAQFSASDGGWTTDGGEPYLIAQADPYDTAAIGDPWADWSRTVSGSSVASYFGLAKVTAIEVTSRDGNGDWGGRVLAGFVDGTDSSGHAEHVSVTGTDLADAMDLPLNWFTIMTAPPLGHLDSITQTGEHTWTVAGWAYDPTSASASTKVDAYVGTAGVTLSANLSRPDVQAAYGLPNAAHGFDATVTVPSGTFQLCLYALSADGSTRALVGCRTVNSSPPPIGVVDSITQVSEHSWQVTGWTYDPGAITASIPVSVQIGSVSTPAVANLSRPDVQAVEHLPGPAHGFSVKVTVAPGTAQLCVYSLTADSAASGFKTLLRCQAVASPAAPMGVLDSVTQTGETTWTLTGWTFDPGSVATSTSVVATVGATSVSGKASLARPDVAAVYKLPSALHGFSIAVTVPAGTSKVCATALSVDGLIKTALPCRTLTVSTAGPIGIVDSIVQIAPHKWTITGWAYDRSWTSASVRVDSYVGLTGFSTQANLSRPDVQRVYGLPGAAHGFKVTVTVPTGRWQLVVNAIAGDGTAPHPVIRVQSLTD